MLHILIDKGIERGIVMRILIFSDSHADISLCSALIEKIGADIVLHAGDHARDAEKLLEKFPDLDIRFVCGNCDFIDTPTELNFCIENKNIFLTHGHKFNVKHDYEYKKLHYKALEIGADLAVFGHTHDPYNCDYGNIILLNPGSIKYTRTFGIAEIENNKLRADICDANLWL